MAGVPADYHRASVAEKQRMQRSQIRAPAIACPFCEIKTSEDGLLAHVDERCDGRRPVHPLSRWVVWSDAIALGADKQTLARWVRNGLVRVRGERGEREYLLRDLQQRLALQRPHPRLRTEGSEG